MENQNRRDFLGKVAKDVALGALCYSNTNYYR